MDYLTLDASAYGDDELPARGGDWVVSGNPPSQIAQIKRVYRDSSWPGHASEGFLADLIIYDMSGNKIGRESESVPIKVGDMVIRGPRTFEPCCRLDYWHRIEKPEFPLTFGWTTTLDGKTVLGHQTTIRKWGVYKRRKRTPVAVIEVSKPNYDPELERRARMLAAEKLRDLAREQKMPELKGLAEELEREAKEL